VKKIITGTFKGEDGSLGYRTGKFYALCVEENPSRLQQILNRWPRDWEMIIIKPTFCPYSSRAKFEANWEINHEESV
jgi:hypothetical protein